MRGEKNKKKQNFTFVWGPRAGSRVSFPLSRPPAEEGKKGTSGFVVTSSHAQWAPHDEARRAFPFNLLFLFSSLSLSRSFLCVVLPRFLRPRVRRTRGGLRACSHLRLLSASGRKHPSDLELAWATRNLPFPATSYRFFGDTDCESDWNLMSFESDEYNVPIISCKTGNISEHHQPEHRGSCLEKYDQEVLTMNDFSPYATPPLSPMSSYASCSSSFGDIWTGLNLQGREDGCGVIDTGEKQRDPGIWEPPEPECMEDDQPSIADNYEDDEYSSTDWKQPSSLSILDEHQGINHSFREKRQKAMLEEMNRQFKMMVRVG
ncbi:Phosphatidylinositol-4-phosphate 5-Kinase [Musa troglodytarum]|uniref:Phosphatidylinositol-4-phosphate 5-Kinase n=1 Tax=Musa troglodytarum TaxID=320322 RepID=A0A9E7H3C6_9LILI|nr:Phosphatidylinositol-4-phosphate 5-Kinase [Musa troglodytarum]